MAYRFEWNKQLDEKFRRVAREQVDKGLKELEQAVDNPHETVHQVRKRCKKLRGLLRLVRPVFPDYTRENKNIRDAARMLSPLRDAGSMLETVDLLAKMIPEEERTLLLPVRTELLRQQIKTSNENAHFKLTLDSFEKAFQDLRKRIDCWELRDNGPGDIFKGYRKTFRRGRHGFSAAYRQPTSASFHEWRKRVKYHWYHLRLLISAWPDLLQVQKDAADQLGSLLGDEHDLAVLTATIEANPERFGAAEDIGRLLSRIETLQQNLRTRSWPIGARLYAEKPKPAARRIKSYWLVGRNEAEKTAPVRPLAT
jgi:CHAD domain-containing protein